MRRFGFLFLLIPLLLAVAFGACRRNEQRYELKGKVLMVEKEKHLVTIAHDEVQGLMPAMTMPFTVPNQSDIDYLAPDDQVTATLVIDGSHSWLENLFVTRISGDASSVALPKEANEGDEVPNFALLNQDGKQIQIKD